MLAEALIKISELQANMNSIMNGNINLESNKIKKIHETADVLNSRQYHSEEDHQHINTVLFTGLVGKIWTGNQDWCIHVKRKEEVVIRECDKSNTRRQWFLLVGSQIRWVEVARTLCLTWKEAFNRFAFEKCEPERSEEQSFILAKQNNPLKKVIKFEAKQKCLSYQKEKDLNPLYLEDCSKGTKWSTDLIRLPKVSIATPFGS
eukprot:UN33830